VGRAAAIATLLCLLTAAVFAPVLGHGFLHFDDGIYVTENPAVRAGLTWPGVRWAFSSVHHSNWTPLTWLSHMLDVELFGLAPAGHHLVNVLLHVSNAVLLFAVFRRMTGALRRSALVAALFAVHPLHVEPVAWIATRKDLLSTFFGLLSLWCYAGFAVRARRRDYGLALLFAALSLLAKQMLVTLPLILLLLDWWPLRRLSPARPGRRARRREGSGPGVAALLLEKAPFFALSFAASVAAFLAQRRGGSVADLEMLSLWRRIDNAVVSWVIYVEKTIVPAGLCAFYPFPSEPHSGWLLGGSLVGLVALTVVAVWALRERRYPAVGWLWFLVTLVPVIGLVQIGNQALADRYTYVPLIGLFVVVSFGAADLFDRWRLPDAAFTAMCIALPCALAFPASRQVRTWQSDQTLFERALAVTEANFTAHNNLGNVLHARGENDAAARHLEAALRLRPDSPKAHNNLANTYLDLGRTADALRHLKLALRLAPDAFQVHFNLAGVLAKLGRTDEAIAHYRRAAELEPALTARVQQRLRSLR